MLFILLAFLVLSVAFFGLGLLLWWGLRRATGLPLAQPLWGELGLLGLFGFGVAAVLWNFVLPIKSAFAWPLLALGGVVLVSAALRTVELKRSLAEIAIPAILTAAALSVLVAFTPLHYDAGLYHLPAQLWARSAPAAIGLSHFHHRLGLNSIVEPISAALWLRGNLILVGVADALFVFFYLLTILQFLREERAREMPLSLAFAMLSPLSLLLFNRHFLFSIGIDDVPAAMLMLTCVFAFIRAGESRRAPDEGLTSLSILVVLSAFAISVKLSSVTIAILPAIAVLSSIRSGVHARRWAAPFLVSGALVLPVIARGVLLSGCLLFPLAGTCLESLPWSNRSDAEQVTAAITSYARTRGERDLDASGWAWIPSWWQRYRPLFLRVTIATLAVSAAAWASRTALCRGAPAAEAGWTGTEQRRGAAGVALFCVASLGLWFTRGPDPRFGAAALHVLTLTPALLLLAAQTRPWPLEPKVWRVAGTIGTVLTLLVAVEIATLSWPLTGDRASLFYSRLGTPAVETVPNRHFGVRPSEGDQCWLSRSPCSPFDQTISVARRGRWMVIEPLSLGGGRDP